MCFTIDIVSIALNSHYPGWNQLKYVEQLPDNLLNRNLAGPQFPPFPTKGDNGIDPIASHCEDIVTVG